MKLNILAEAANIACREEFSEIEITGIADHSGHVAFGNLFVCIKGFHKDGHEMIPEARARGAACILVEKGSQYPIFEDLIYLETENTRKALSYLFNAWYGNPTAKMKLIGVTGTNGKTTVTNMIRQILSAAFYRTGLIGTVGCESVGRHLENHNNDHLANMTTPDPADLYRMFAEMAEDGVEYVVMEVTSHALTLEKLAPLHFSAAVFTNLTPEHLDFHKTMEAYAEAKAKLFSKSDFSVINSDSPFSRLMQEKSNCAITCSLVDENATYFAKEIVSDDTTVRYSLLSGTARMRLSCPIPGKFTVMNSMQAVVCALELGISPSIVRGAIASLSGVKGRMERVKLGGLTDFSVFIDYAHTPDALENLLLTARELKKPGGRIVLLFGCGGDRDRNKRPIMGRIATTLADEVVVTSDNSRSEDPNTIIEEILSGVSDFGRLKRITDRREAIFEVIGKAKAGDIILLAGKGHEEYEIGANGRTRFSETEIVKEAYQTVYRQNKE